MSVVGAISPPIYTSVILMLYCNYVCMCVCGGNLTLVFGRAHMIMQLLWT